MKRNIKFGNYRLNRELSLLLNNMLIYFLLFLVLYSTTKHLLRKLTNNPPGPFFTLPFIGHIIHLIITNKSSFHKQLNALSNKHGPILSLQLGHRKVLVVSSSWAAEECLSLKNDLIFANRPNLLAGKYEGYNFTSMSWTPYGDHWRNLRRVLSMQLLSSQRMESFSYIVLEDVRSLVRNIFRLSYEKNSIVSMRTMMFEYLFNVTTKMMLGKRYYGEKAVISEEAKEFQGIIEEMHEAVNISTMVDFIPWLPYWSGKANEIYKAIHERRDKFLQGMIEGVRKRNEPTSEDSATLLQVLLSLHGSDPEYYTDETIKGIMAVLLTGGSDSSVSTMEWAMTLLLNNPTVIEKAQAEIDNHVGHHRLVDDADFAKLPYLNCILKETLRLYPNVPLLMPHESSKETIVGGFRVPRGTMLLINAWAIHHDPTIWKDPHVFKPERFMTTTDHQTSNNNSAKEEFKYMPFGKGRRGCPAEALAIRMIGLALGSLIQCFHWERTSEEMEDLGETGGISITKTRPLMAKFQPRTSMVVNLLSPH